MQERLHPNRLVLEGMVTSAPVFSHENHQTAFYRFTLTVPRLSGLADTLPVLVSASMVEGIHLGEPFRLAGQLRSYNNKSGTGNRLVLSAFVQESLPPLGEPYNSLQLHGTLCKPPQYRHTPLGRRICDLMLAVPRPYGRSDYLPIIAWGGLALHTGQLSVGDPLALEGRMQSRVYQKTIDGVVSTHTAYEVSMMRLLECTQD